ncbi:MAG: hypothetical protein U9R58_03130 [Chloroflexota bacterium]|nr:hypothetical protein [Chloroflexota bacterium]
MDIVKFTSEKTIIFIGCVLLFSTIFLSCTHFPTQDSILKIEVVSMEYYLPRLMERAKQWKEDAYLVNVFMPLLHDEGIKPDWLISADYMSDSRNEEGLVTILMLDERITTEKVDFSKPKSPKKPLTKQEWKYDSQEALDLILVNEDVQKHLRSYDAFSLTLEHFNNIDQYPIWILTLTKPDFSGSIYYYLNPANDSVQELIR